MDLLSASEEEHAMVAQDSLGSDDLDDTTVHLDSTTQTKKTLRKYTMKAFLNKT